MRGTKPTHPRMRQLRYRIGHRSFHETELWIPLTMLFQRLLMIDGWQLAVDPGFPRSSPSPLSDGVELGGLGAPRAFLHGRFYTLLASGTGAIRNVLWGKSCHWRRIYWSTMQVRLRASDSGGATAKSRGEGCSADEARGLSFCWQIADSS